MLKELGKEIHKNAVEHGWWDSPRTFGDIIALCHSELSEALEEHRQSRPAIYYNCIQNPALIEPCTCDDDEMDCCPLAKVRDGVCEYRDQKPEGVAIELADCIIRILDYCEYAGIDIEKAISLKHEYNKTRPYRHGGKII